MQSFPQSQDLELERKAKHIKYQGPKTYGNAGVDLGNSYFQGILRDTESIRELGLDFKWF